MIRGCGWGKAECGRTVERRSPDLILRDQGPLPEVTLWIKHICITAGQRGVSRLGSTLFDMATLYKVTALWQNWPGAPGYTNFYGTEGSGVSLLTDGVRAFFDAIKALIPSGITITVQPSGDTINDTNGNINGAWTVDPAPAIVTGSGTGTYAGNAGGVVTWRTNGVVGTRRVRGRSFLVPLASSNFDTNGLGAGAINTLQTAANGLVTAAGGTLAVWSRPTTLRSGSSHLVTAATVPDLAASLRSRRR